MMGVPCRDCITLGMCKARLNNGDLLDLLCLTDQCSLLRSYLYPKATNGDGTCKVSLISYVEDVLCANINYSKEPI